MNDAPNVTTLPSRPQSLHDLAMAYRREAGRAEMYFSAWEKCRGKLKEHFDNLYRIHDHAADLLFDRILDFQPQTEEDAAISLDAIIMLADRDWDSDEYVAKRERLANSMRLLLAGRDVPGTLLKPITDMHELGEAFEQWFETRDDATAPTEEEAQAAE